MAETLSDIIEGKTEVAATPTPEPTPAPAAAPVAVATPTPAPEPAKPDSGFVPLAAVLDEREKRKEAERRLAEFEAAQQTPSVPVEPEQLAAYIAEQTNRVATSTRFDVSEAIATQTHGENAVKAAMDWGMQKAQASPAFAAEYLRQKNPIDWAVRQHKRDQLISELGDDEPTQKAWVEKRAREWGLIPAAPTATPQGASAPAAPQPVPSQPKPVPAPSLASAPSAGGLQSIPTGSGVAFDGIFR